MPAAATKEFTGSLRAVMWLRENGYSKDEGVSDAIVFVKGQEYALLIEGKLGAKLVVTNGGHRPAVCRRTGQTRYSFRNHSATFECPSCAVQKKQSLNFLGERNLVCIGDGKLRPVPFHRA